MLLYKGTRTLCQANVPSAVVPIDEEGVTVSTVVEVIMHFTTAVLEALLLEAVVKAEPILENTHSPIVPEVSSDWVVDTFSEGDAQVLYSGRCLFDGAVDDLGYLDGLLGWVLTVARSTNHEGQC